MRTHVTEDDVRPAGTPGECFYCKRKIGEEHAWECVSVRRPVVIEMRFLRPIQYVVQVPRSWDERAITFHRNESSWCKSSALDELDARVDCLCDDVEFSYVREATEREWTEQQEGRDS